MSINRTTIPKIYISNFLTGLVFWYGIEKLFMRHIGINAIGIGVVSLAYYAVTLTLDIPAGMLADKWSRKGVLMLSAVSLALASVVCGTSHSLGQYAVGYVLYGFYLVATSGTYQSLTYDALHEQGRADDYSKIIGRAYALFLAGAGVANIASGFIARSGNLELPFLVSIIPCVLNLAVMASISEPTFHKKERKEKMLPLLSKSVGAMVAIALLRSLTVAWCVLAVAAPFTEEFAQVYMLHFSTNPVTLGIWWALEAFTWALGSVVAHRAKGKLAWFVAASFVVAIVLGLVTSVWGLVLLFVQVAVGQVALNLIETQVQDATPSAVRTSVMSVLSSLGRFVEVPCVLLFGWLTVHYGVFAMVRFVAAASAVGLGYWLLLGIRRLRTASDVQPTTPLENFNKP